MDVENKRFLLGIFEDDHHLVEAVHDLNDQKVEIFDCFTPFPIHGLDELVGIKRTRLPIVTFCAAMFGATFAVGFQLWTSAVDWPINVGGKSFLSLPAFIPVAFEIAVLLGALTTVAAFFLRAKLCPISKAKIPDIKVTDNRFVVAIEIKDAALNESGIRNIFSKHHAKEIRYSEGSTW